MRRQTEVFNAILEPKTIDDCSERASAFAKSIKLSDSDCLKYGFTVDEILLKTSDVAEGAEVTFTTGTRLLRPYMSVAIKAAPFNAFQTNEDEGSLLGNSILKNLGLSPEYSYTNGQNTYFFRMKKKSMNPLLKLLIALGAAIICSLLGLLMPYEFRAGILDNLLNPVYDTFFNILGCIAGPMVFLSVAWGIYGIGDAATLKKIGKKLLGNYAGAVFIVSLVFAFACMGAFALKFSGSGEGTGGISAIFAMVLAIIPKNIFSPFVDGNTLQIIFLAVVVGIALLFLGQKTRSVARAVEQINYLVQFLVEFICKLVPFFIFIAIIEMFWSDSAAILTTVGKFFIVLIACVVVEALFFVTYASITNKVNPIKIAKKGFPTLLIALSTASSAAAFGPNINACNNSYGIDKKMTAFGVPLGMVVFKPSTAISYVAISLFCCGAYDVEISISWFAMMVFTVAILAIATPPVPGGGITAYTVLFAQLGIPVEALAIAIACDTIVDFIVTGCDQFLIPIELLGQARKLGMVDQETLRK